MIINTIFDLFISLFENLLSPFTNFHLGFNLDFFQPFFDVLNVILYIMPSLSFFTPILVLISTLYTIRIIIAIYKLLPLT